MALLGPFARRCVTHFSTPKFHVERAWRRVDLPALLGPARTTNFLKLEFVIVKVFEVSDFDTSNHIGFIKLRAEL